MEGYYTDNTIKELSLNRPWPHLTKLVIRGNHQATGIGFYGTWKFLRDFFFTNEDPMGKRLVFLLGPGHYASNTNSRSCVPT